MPYQAFKRGDKWEVFKLDAEGNPIGKSHGTHDSRAEANSQVRALYAAEGDGKSLHVFKQADGTYRYFGWVSNHFRDNDTPREIISGDAHKEYVQWADETGIYPELQYWHIHGSKMARADWAEFADGFLMLSGVFDKDMGDVAERIAKSPEEYAMSHGFVRLKHDPRSVVTDRYRMIEHSIVPKGFEANPWTSFMAMEDSTMPISPHKKQKLIELFGEERVAAIEAGTLDKAQAAKDAGVDYKEIESLEPLDAPEATSTAIPETKENPIDVKALATALIDELQLESLSTLVADLKTKAEADTTTIKALADKVDALEAVVKELKKSDDEKIAEVLTPKAAKTLSWFRDGFVASESDKTKLKEGDPDDEKLKQAQPSAIERFVAAIIS